jgi:hypothetical protein
MSFIRSLSAILIEDRTLVHLTAGTRGLCVEGTQSTVRDFHSREARFLWEDVIYGHLAIGGRLEAYLLTYVRNHLLKMS